MNAQANPPLPTLEAARLRLRPYLDSDSTALFALYGDPKVTRYWSHPAWTDPAQAYLYLSLRKDEPTTTVHAWAIADKTSNELIGALTFFSISGVHARAEVGYSLMSNLQGLGLGKEALSTALKYGFEVLNLYRIEADVDPRNTGSIKLLEKLNFQREGLLRQRWRVNGEVCDSVLYGLLKEDYLPA
ncbi:MAG: GNAT family N-acetyltransferase [Arenimonas sp.]